MVKSRSSETVQLLEVRQKWAKFALKFPTEESCLAELLNRASATRKLSCRYCGSQNLGQGSVRRLIHCQDCKKNISMTAGTIFHRMRIARAWLGAIWLLENGVTISAFQFHLLARVAYSTAWNIFSKLATVITEEMPADAQHISTGAFSAVFRRRSRETPKRLQPVAEQFDIDNLLTENQPDCAKPESLDQRTIYELLGAKATHFDELYQRAGLPVGQLLSNLTLLELDGHIKAHAGGWYSKVQADSSGKSTSPQNRDLEKHAAKAIDYIRRFFQGVSRKYLQHYLSLFWCHMDRKRWGSGALLLACLNSVPIPYRRTLAFVTPPNARLACLH